MALTKDDIQKVNDSSVKKVLVPEWGGDVYVRVLSGKDYDAYEEKSVIRRGDRIEENKHNIKARFAAYSLCDEHGKPLYDNPEQAAVELGQRNNVALLRIWIAGNRLNGLSKLDVEELAKNFSGGESDDLPTG